VVDPTKSSIDEAPEQNHRNRFFSLKQMPQPCSMASATVLVLTRDSSRAQYEKRGEDVPEKTRDEREDALVIDTGVYPYLRAVLVM